MGIGSWLRRSAKQGPHEVAAPAVYGQERLTGGAVEIGDENQFGVLPPGEFPMQSPESVLLITLDSCRYDTFAAAHVPNLRRIGALHRAMAPAHFTLASHTSIFAGFTPGRADVREPHLNPKYSRIFRLAGPSGRTSGQEFLILNGRTIIDGFKNIGYLTLGCGGVLWFRPDVPSGRLLSLDFDKFYWGGRTSALPNQLAFLSRNMPSDGRRVFTFLNVGETHVPYWHEGCDWDGSYCPCLPFGDNNDAVESRRRQTACLEYTDRLLGPLLAAFGSSTIIACADHGDCWGEDGLWEHTIFHEKVFEVPLLYRLGKRPD